LKKGEHGEMLIDVVLAEKKRVFLVDTGWGRTALNEATARGLKSLGELGLKLDDTFWGTLADPSIVLMDKLRIGPAQFLNQPARVRKLRMDFVSVRFDGILGCDFLFRNFCLIDCVGRRLYVRGSKPAEDVTSAIETSFRRSGFTEVPIVMGHGLTIDAKVNDELLKMIVDTGSDFTVLDSEFAKRLGLSPLKRDDPALGSLIKDDLSAYLVGVGTIGAHKLRVVTLKQLEVGALQWTNVHVGVVDLKKWESADSRTKGRVVQGLLGREILTTRGALIDCHSRKLWFQTTK
jgi:predicted aspartyl protease